MLEKSLFYLIGQALCFCPSKSFRMTETSLYTFYLTLRAVKLWVSNFGLSNMKSPRLGRKGVNVETKSEGYLIGSPKPLIQLMPANGFEPLTPRV